MYSWGYRDMLKILFVTPSARTTIAKSTEAFRTGLRAMFDTRFFGRGYGGYREGLKTYQEIIDLTFGETPDVMIVGFYGSDRGRANWWEMAPMPYEGLPEVDCLKFIVLTDYWHYRGVEREVANMWWERGVNAALTNFSGAIPWYLGSPFKDRLFCVPLSFDPQIFNWRRLEKKYDIGFLGAGTTEERRIYPERFRIHRRLLATGYEYLWSEHPGATRQYENEEHPLVGVGFSNRIGECKLFVNTAGQWFHTNPKYIEIMASGTCMLAQKPEDTELLRLEDGVNYVKLDEEHLEEQVAYYLEHDEEREAIARAGYLTAMRHHTCYARAIDFLEAIKPVLPQFRRLK